MITARNAEDVQRAADAAAERFGGVDVVVNNASATPGNAHRRDRRLPTTTTTDNEDHERR